MEGTERKGLGNVCTELDGVVSTGSCAQSNSTAKGIGTKRRNDNVKLFFEGWGYVGLTVMWPCVAEPGTEMRPSGKEM
jgi:hypothetical protein